MYVQSLTQDQRERISEPLNQVTIYADEEAREHAKLNVFLQVQHATTNPVISSSLAAQSCKALGTDGMLRELNTALRTSYSISVPGLLPHLEQCIERNYDFGTAFGRLRNYWFEDFETLETILDARERADGEDRARALDTKRSLITNTRISPRRVWDLYSNRVLPIWVARNFPKYTQLWAISHSWMEDNRRTLVDTPINGREWRVPIPDDVTLDCIRVELLNLGAEYAWLDVLCLRQFDDLKLENEDLRMEEWKLDVPTIGGVYWYSSDIVTYFNGLGRPFEVVDSKSERNWTKRAWTLQEASPHTHIGGLTVDSPTQSVVPRPDWWLMMSGSHLKRFYDDLHMTLSAGQDLFYDVFLVLGVMLARAASFEVDRIAGLAYILRSGVLPAYVRGEDTHDAHEKAWSHLIMAMEDHHRAQLVCKYSAPGDGTVTWRPSWSQLKDTKQIPLPPTTLGKPLLRHFHFKSSTYEVREDGTYTDEWLLLRNCSIQDLDESDTAGCCRRGKLIVTMDYAVDVEHSFAVNAHHQYPISKDESYVLIGPSDEREQDQDYFFWMVGVLLASEGTVRKVSVLEMEDKNDRDRLRKLGLARNEILTLV
ncbi:hypothetical protein NM688_g1512 [Phlebia brevispora]|uniref:Uncharacterized protein n=1 Tax=Phlebia brevispora TaxID=194682 RepID=A0ACC1TAX5_9APHY|nr:hypothetical protein NM688_g1512 [Phlebia brevispora]